ncbi:unnamed protein product [Psylliodes chrysocephalus]|uniref:Uncharacterized protein n=1 Tax=Psylliodes chrysocephalus TaxID=3402493 RepID=A0A9P0GL83_9CUCU|nr:unnamed protein product [Psylliodes chrysocephala]
MGVAYIPLVLLSPLLSSERALPFPCELPLAWRDSPTFEILYTIQYISLHLSINYGTQGSDDLVLCICEAAANQYRILQKCFLAFNTPAKTTTVQLIITYIYIFGFLFQLGIDCFIGNDLYNQAVLLTDCIFESNWTSIESKEFRKDIAFVIQQSQQYPKFTAYNIYDLNMVSFGKVYE